MFGGQNTILWGKILIFIMFETNFSEHNKIWGAQNIFGDNFPHMPPCLGAWAEPSPEGLPLGTFIFVQGGLTF